ncbi:MAG: metalloregulator ArsR/SmtB family transcription factor [Gammaproteobacteria bacterium]|nr:metalloregulator ArsR/SmtB family transcription factor [Gammaproteobacteria bacterium]
MVKLLAALRAAGESTRLRILSVLSSSELTVSELMHILDQSQPRVSRHLKLLCDAGLLQRYQEGAWVFHRINDSGSMATTTRGILDLIDQTDRVLSLDRYRLQEIKQRNADRAAEYFRKNAGDWDSIRKLAVPDTDVEKKLIECLGPDQPKLFLDLGTGTGRILEILSPHIEKGIGIDLSREMLLVARSNLDSAGTANCTIRQGDLSQLPIEDESVDAISIHQVLHYLENPRRVIEEAARVLKPGGQLIIVDFLPHDLEFLRENHAHRRLGFSDQTISSWATGNQLCVHRREKLVPPGNGDKKSLSIGLWSLRKIQDHPDIRQ